MLTFAFCTYNRAHRLESLVAAMRAQECPVPFEILVVNNNSTDSTPEILAQLAQMPGPKLRWVTEIAQGIVPARNRLIAEALDSEYLLMLDDDELPGPAWLSAGFDALHREEAECVSGPITVDFRIIPAPAWLNKELRGFLGEVDYGNEAFWNTTQSQPFYTGNIGYRMSLFRKHPELRFDTRYNRAGEGIGGGSDKHMYGRLIEMGVRLRYRPEMLIYHHVDEWKLRRNYFLRLHHRAGIRNARYGGAIYTRTIVGVPPFLLVQALRNSTKALTMAIAGHADALRQGMNATHAWGLVRGTYLQWRDQQYSQPNKEAR